MLTVEQVKSHSEVSLGRRPLSELEGLKLYNGETDGLPDFTKSMARLLYIHEERAHKMRIFCQLKESIPSSKVRDQTEQIIKETIDWDRFTNWINRHDDIGEDCLVTKETWPHFDYTYYKQGRMGRDGILDTIKGEVIDCHRIVLV